MVDLLPLGPRCNLGALSVDVFPIKLATARVDVDVLRLDPSLALPDVTDSIEEEDDWGGEVRLEEAFGGADAHANGRDGSVELGCC
jgi:hypothetical protein